MIIQEDKISRNSSAGTINSGSQSSSPLAELDEEYELNDNNIPPLKTKIKPIGETPVGWLMQADPISGLPCFVNQSTGAKVNNKYLLYIQILNKSSNLLSINLY